MKTLLTLIASLLISKNAWATNLGSNHEINVPEHQKKASFQFQKFSEALIPIMESMTKYALKPSPNGKDKKIYSIFDPSFISATIFLIPREIYDVNKYDELIESLELAYLPPKGWKWGELAWNEFRKQMLNTLKKHKPLFDNALKYYIKEARPNNYINLASVGSIKENQINVIDFTTIDVNRLIKITKSKGDLKPLKEYLINQNILPRFFPFSRKAQENWEKFRDGIIYN